jgi:hypothetical protein
LKDKIFVSHRAINSKQSYKDFLVKQKNSTNILSAEGDLCWYLTNDKIVIYMYHPNFTGRGKSIKEIKNQKHNLLKLNEILEMSSESNLILELKNGIGSVDKFIKALVELIKNRKQNILIDSFCAKDLYILKKIDKNIKTSLHTKFIFYKYLLETSYRFPFVKIHNLYNLDYVDYITISHTTTYVNLFNVNIDYAYRHIFKSNKMLNLGSIKSIKSLKNSINSRAKYIYLRSKKSIMFLNEQGKNI